MDITIANQLIEFYPRSIDFKGWFVYLGFQNINFVKPMAVPVFWRSLDSLDISSRYSMLSEVTGSDKSKMVAAKP